MTTCLKRGPSLSHPPGAGGLRVEPASAPLWAALGACAVAPAVREHALARALALDPKAAPAWVELGRLYCSNGVHHAPQQSPCMRPLLTWIHARNCSFPKSHNSVGKLCEALDMVPTLCSLPRLHVQGRNTGPCVFRPV